jgi:CheY-like chemotaxis protein
MTATDPEGPRSIRQADGGRGRRLSTDGFGAGGGAVGASAPGAAGSRLVLLIDDHGDSCEAMELLLRQKGHRVLTAADGREGVDLAASSRPDVVLVDIGLPSIDGYEVARRLRAASDRPLTIVAVTGYTSPADRARAEEAGFDDYLVKPVDIERLAALIAAPPREHQ